MGRVGNGFHRTRAVIIEFYRNGNILHPVGKPGFGIDPVRSVIHRNIKLDTVKLDHVSGLVDRIGVCSGNNAVGHINAVLGCEGLRGFSRIGRTSGAASGRTGNRTGITGCVGRVIAFCLCCAVLAAGAKHQNGRDQKRRRSK